MMNEKELSFPGSLKRGDTGQGVKRLQEWLNLNSYKILIDGEFGPATEYAVVDFNRKRNMDAFNPIAAPETFDALTQPMSMALRPLSKVGSLMMSLVALKIKNITEKRVDFQSLVCHFALQHLAAGAREVGGENRGPWVRLYGLGQENMPWCAGFVSFILRQSQAQHLVMYKLPHPKITAYTLSCDELATEAKMKKIFVSGADVIEKKIIIPPGSIFLIRKTPYDWIHTGIVLSHENGAIITVEGNTNDNGSREGFEVAKRIRKVTGSIDFIVWGKD
jgi:hypothetical protein